MTDELFDVVLVIGGPFRAAPAADRLVAPRGSSPNRGGITAADQTQTSHRWSDRTASDTNDAHAALAQQARIHDRMIERSAGPEGSRRSHIMAYADNDGATEAHALFGPPPDIIAGIRALHAVGVRYVLISGGDARRSMRRFAAEVMPGLRPER